MQLSLTGILMLAGSLGCGGEQRSSGAAVDTARSAAADTSLSMPTDSSRAPAHDTAMATKPDSTATRPDTAKAVAAKPAPRRPTTTRPSTPKPTARRQPTDTNAADTAKASARPENNAAAQPPETAAAASTNQASAPLRDPYHQAPKDTVSQQVYDGWKQFNLNCARCHGEDVQGTTIAPHLIVSLKPDGPINTKELFVQTVCAGRPAKGMPSWCALGMEMSTIEEIYSYVKGRSDAKIHPGRPAVRSGG
jgi:mono/diheme cytochrome c family protein